MASAINVEAYSDSLVVLGTAAIVVPLLKRFGVSPVLGYLGAGALLGPLGLGTFAKDVPGLFWITITDAKSVAGIAELGIVFLLFLIGLELSYSRLKNLRRLVFGLGGLQVAFSTAAIGAVLVHFGNSAPTAVIIGACLALSSTAIVMQLLADQQRLNSSTGRASFAILLAQDLAVIPVLLFISILGSNSSGNIFLTVGDCPFSSSGRDHRARGGRAAGLTTALSAGGRNAFERDLHRAVAVRRCLLGRRRRPGGVVNGPRFVRRGVAARRDRVSQGHRGGD